MEPWNQMQNTRNGEQWSANNTRRRPDNSITSEYYKKTIVKYLNHVYNKRLSYLVYLVQRQLLTFTIFLTPRRSHCTLSFNTCTLYSRWNVQLLDINLHLYPLWAHAFMSQGILHLPSCCVFFLQVLYSMGVCKQYVHIWRQKNVKICSQPSLSISISPPPPI